MNVEIYYFSGTGNSLAVARDIASQVKGKLISIPDVIEKQNIKTDADIIGLVFPSYMAQLNGVPFIVERFVKKLENIGSKYIFAVCTCGAHKIFNGFPTIMNLNRVIKSMGGKLSAEFSIRLPMNTLNYSHVPFINKNQEIMFKNCSNKIKYICSCVIGKKESKYRFIKSLFNLLMTPMYLALKKIAIISLRKYSKEPKDTTLKYYEMIALTDKSIYVDEKCDGCAVCEKVCPVKNIKIVDSKPVWQHRCEMCLACDEWCPKRAIHHWSKVKGKDYHHPSVTLSDMMTVTRG